MAGVSRVAAFIRSTARVGWKGSVLDEQIGLVSPDFLEVFSFPLLHGDPATVIERRDAVVISRTAAARLFGERGAGLASVIGQTISVRGREHVVTGVVEDVPAPSSLRFDYLVSYENRSGYFLDRNNVGETSIFVELEERADVQGVENAMTGLIRTQLLALIQSGIPSSVPPEVLSEVSRQLKAHFTDERLGAYTILLQPLSKMHLDLSVESHYVEMGSATYASLLSGLRELEEAWSSVVPGDPFEWSFLDANLEAQYREEERWTRIVGLSAAFVVVITCLGLLGQVAMAVTQRTREIGIRKVLGATAAQVVKLMAAESTVLLGLASAVSWPLSYMALQSWLEGFAYRIELAPWVFLLATGVVMTLTLLLVALQSAGAALRSPADSLRYE